MKRPINFETIDGHDFYIEGHNLYIDIDSKQNKPKLSWVWVFCNGPLLGDYAILFEMKWEHDCMSMKKCVLGEGTTGNWIFQDNLITENIIKTKDAFLSFIEKIIDNRIQSSTFVN